MKLKVKIVLILVNVTCVNKYCLGLKIESMRLAVNKYCLELENLSRVKNPGEVMLLDANKFCLLLKIANWLIV